MIRKEWARVFAKNQYANQPHRQGPDFPAIKVTLAHAGPAVNRPGHTRKFRPPRGSRTLVAGPENRYIGVNLQFSYEQRLRVGPWGPALFYYLEAARQPNARTRLLR